MDVTEDLSARVLLKRILSTEPPRTPITRSVEKAQSSSTTRRSSRLMNKDAAGQTPQDLLRRSLRRKMHESITRKSLPFTKRRTATQRESVWLDSGDTPRGILRKILLTEPARSPAVHKKTETEEPQPSPASDSLPGKHSSIELSGLDLPDVTVAVDPSFTKRLSRKRTRRSLNVTTFEKRLKGGDDVGEECEQSANEQSSLSFASSTSFSLKTPFADVQTEKRGLQRRVSNRRKVTEEEFGAAVHKIEMGGASSFVGLGPSDTAYSEGFTLGLSKLSKPDITTEILHDDATAHVQPDATACGGFQSEEESRSRDSHAEEGDPEPGARVSARSGLVEEEDETAKVSQTGEGDEDIQAEVDGSSRSQPQEDLEADQNSGEEFGGGGSQPEEDVSASLRPAEEQEETAQDSHAETDDEDSQAEVDGSTRSQPQEDPETGQNSGEEFGGGSQPGEDVSASLQLAEEREETAQDSHAVSAQTPEVSGVGGHSEEEESVADDERDHKTSTEEDLPHSQAEDEELEEGDDGRQSEEQEHDEQLDYKDHCSGGGVTSETGESPASQLSPTRQTEREDPEDVADNHDCSEGSRRSEDAAQDGAELEREWEEEEESGEVLSKTPAFVREKRVFSQPLIRNVQPSGASKSSPVKPKQVRKPSRPAGRRGGLPRSYLMNVFKHFAKTKVSADVYPVLKEVMDKFFERLAEDLETYAVHAKRKTIEVEDAELLLRRQGHVNDKVPVEVLIEKYLRLDQRRLLIPIATSGNVVIPKKR